MTKGNTSHRLVEQVEAGEGGISRRTRRDLLATEEPLEIRIVRAEEWSAGLPPSAAAHRIAVTMRTPGDDLELAAGFLFTEALVTRREEIRAIRPCVDPERDGAQQGNILNVFLAPGVAWDPSALQRNFYTTSSCGVCGKASIEAVRGMGCAPLRDDTAAEGEVLFALPARLRKAQRVFERTGGLHAAALFSTGGELLRVREDVGRHNAMDKLIGGALLGGELPFANRILLVSGRLSFELVQKAARAGAPILAGVSAPSSLAIELAEEVGMTLVGFLRDRRFNVYTGGERIIVRSPAPAA